MRTKSCRRLFRLCLALMPAAGCSDPAAGPDLDLSPEADERRVLAALYDATGGPSWTNNDNWLSDRPLSQWRGIHTNSNGRVSGVSLQENGLTGSIPGVVSRLLVLEELLLDGNRITGPIPALLGELSNLRILSLSRNDMSGDVPVPIGRLRQLKVLNLDENRFSGGIPPTFGDLPNLETLSVRNNSLAGAIPFRLGQTPRLRRIRLSGNGFSGPVPLALGGLAGLQELHLDHNQLTGELPGTLIGLPVSYLSWQQNDGLCAPPGDAMVEWLGSVDFAEGPLCQG